MTERQVIPAGEQTEAYAHLLPIVRLLIERGHEPVTEKDRLGFHPTPAGWVCSLEGGLTPEDWAAVNARFLLPPTLVYEVGCIRDHANWVDIEGVQVIS